jgi:hypothetical protein
VGESQDSWEALAAFHDQPDTMRLFAPPVTSEWPTVTGVESRLEHAPDPTAFVRTVAHVQSYVRSESGAYTSLMETARADPEGTTTSLVALGAVLLDLAAGAFAITPDEMLAKVSAGISSHSADPVVEQRR